MRFAVQVLAIFLMLAPAAAAQAWPTTKFEVLNVTYSGFLTKPEKSTEPEPGAAELEKLEAFLAFAARRLEAWGFPAPNLQVNTTARCAKCYHVYMSDLPMNYLPGFSARGYAINTGVSPAHGKYIVLNIDRELATSPDGKTLKPEAYITAVHELVHPVLNSTVFARDVPLEWDGAKNIGDWILEGVPDAIAYSLYMEYFKNSRPGVIDNWQKFYGARAYDIPLAVHSSKLIRDTDASYGSSSFWRYLAELNHKKKAGPTGSLPGPGMEVADYSYLAKLLTTEHTGKGPDKEYAWLDAGLKDPRIMDQSLVHILPRFLATIAGYWEHRVQASFTPAPGQARWLDALYGPCHRISLTPAAISGAYPFTLPELSATCLYVNVAHSASDAYVDISVRTEAEGGDALLEQLWLGTPGGQSLGRATASATINNAHLAVWKNRGAIKPGIPAVFIVSNVARNAGETKQVSGTLRVSMTRASSPVTGPQGRAPDVVPGPDGREEAAIQRARASGTSLSGAGPLGVSMTATEDEMIIQLGAEPDILTVLGDAGGSGGLMDQVLVSGAAIEANLDIYREAMAQAMEYKRTVPGAEVDILLPPLPLGFTGTLPNVRIRSSGGRDADRFTVGPRDAVPGAGVRFDPSGSVTITEYSVWILSGSYKGQLVDPNLSDDQRRQSQPVLDVVGSVEGTFSISAPWIGDERIEKNRISDPWADLEADIKNRLPPSLTAIAADMIDEARRASEANRQPDFSQARSMAASSPASCDCSCAGLAALEQMGEAVDAAGRAPTQSELDLAACAMTCAPQYALCQAD